MRDKWYADNRDLVKWGVLLTLAERHAATHILQVLYYRPTEWAYLEVDGEHVPVPVAVIRHFRRTSAVSAIDAPVPIEVVADTFENRGEYHRAVVDRIRRRSTTPGIVFLDPDTGLASRTPTLDHVLDSELSTLQIGTVNRGFRLRRSSSSGQSGCPSALRNWRWRRKSRETLYSSMLGRLANARMEPTRC